MNTMEEYRVCLGLPRKMREQCYRQLLSFFFTNIRVVDNSICIVVMTFFSLTLRTVAENHENSLLLSLNKYLQ